MTRRELLLGLGALAALACESPPPPRAAAPTPKAPPPPAAPLGRARLAQVGAEAGREELARLLFPDGRVPSTPGEVVAALAPQIEADWAAGRVELVEDWLLSQTEARAVALWALDAPR